MADLIPPQGDPRREAIHLFRGIAYQVWQSVHAWLTLGREESLYLERAEDFAVDAQEKVAAVQVKLRGRNITLGSKEALDAVNSLWALQEKNSTRQLHLRFLTTAARSHEHGSPFGVLNGLDYWDACKQGQADTKPLRQFLSSQKSLRSDLKNFIDTASDDDLRRRLLSRLEWLTQRTSITGVEERVDRLLIEHGETCGVFPDDARSVKHRLFQRIIEVICQSDERQLQRSDFLELFQEACTIRVPRQYLERIQRLEDLTFGAAADFGPEASTHKFTSGTNDVLTNLRMAAPPETLPRTTLVAILSERLNKSQFLALIGSTGIGKSVLAGLVAASTPGVWVRLDCRGMSAQQVRTRLERAAQEISSGSRRGCILDDLPLSSGAAAYEDALAGFLYEARERGLAVIVTTDVPIPSTVAGRLNLAANADVQVPPFSESDISDLAVRNGCPPERLMAWARLIFTRTQGHPQLAHAWVRKLQAERWPVVTLTHVTSREPFADVQREARVRVQEQLPSETARNLAFRLSVFTHPFRKEHALRLAGTTNPGEAFDLLLGPWIEQITEDQYRLSPLLGNSAQEVFTHAEVVALHGAAARAVLSSRVVDQTVLSGGLFHSIMGNSIPTLAGCLRAIDDAPKESFREISTSIDWIVLLPGEQLFPSNPFLHFMLRRLQFRVAVAQAEHKRAIEIARAWEHDIEEYRGISREKADSLRLFFLSTSVIETSVPFPYEEIVNRTFRAHDLLQNVVVPKPIVEAGFAPDELTHLLRESLIRRCRTASDVAHLLHALESRHEREAQPILAMLRDDPGLAIYMLTLAVEPPSAERAPSDVICRVLDTAATLGRTKKVESLVAAAYRAKAILKAEVERDADAALKVLDDATHEFGQVHPVAEEYRARILFLAGRLEEALAVWRGVLPVWCAGAVFERALGHRHASVAAGRLGQWNDAAAFSHAGAVLMSDAGFAGLATGMHADRAFSLWKLGNREAAIIAFADVLEDLERLPDPEADFRSFALRKLVGNAILWMLTQIKGSSFRPTSNAAEPPPGNFSQLEFNKLLKTLPPSPTDITWVLLAEIEFLVTKTGPIRKRWCERAAKSALPTSKWLGAELTLRWMLRDVDLDNLASAAVALKHSRVALTEHTKAGRGVAEKLATAPQLADESDVIETVLLILAHGLVALSATRSLAAAPLDVWRASVMTLGLPLQHFDKWVVFVRDCLLDPSRAFPVLNDTTATRAMRFTAAVLVDALEVRLEECLYAHLTLLDFVRNFGCAPGIEAHLARLVSEAWSVIATERRFALLSPNINAPPIIEACRDESVTGLTKVARVLRAACDTVRWKMPQLFIDMFRAIERTVPNEP